MTKPPEHGQDKDSAKGGSIPLKVHGLAVGV